MTDNVVQSGGSGDGTGATGLSARQHAGEAGESGRNNKTGEDFDSKLHLMILCAAYVVLMLQIHRLIHEGFLPAKIADEAFEQSHGRHRHIHHGTAHPGKKRPGGLFKKQ